VACSTPTSFGDTGNRHHPFAFQLVAKRLALDIGHHIIKKTFTFTRIEERQNVRVVEPGGDPDLAEEALRPE